ncbi:MAG: DJ-1/PfpI family protein [Acidobacteriota bacterium]
MLAGTSVAAEAKKRNVAIVVWDGAELLDWAGPGEVFAAGSSFGGLGDGAFEVYTVSKTTDGIQSQGFVKVVPEYSIHDAPEPDILVLPGGGTSSVMKDSEFLAWVKRTAIEAEVALSVCTGAFLLAETGLLDGKDVTTWHGAIEGLANTYPALRVHPGRRFIDNGQCITTAGVSAGIDGSLHLVARLLGRRVADQTAAYMEYRWTPEPHLVKSYSLLNPSLDERGRALQQAGIHVEEKNWTAALEAYSAHLRVEPDDEHVQYQLATTLYRAGRHAEAVDAFLRSARSERHAVSALYNAACSAALAGDRKAALVHLASALESGRIDGAQVRGDADLSSLHGDPSFEQLLRGQPGS